MAIRTSTWSMRGVENGRTSAHIPLRSEMRGAVGGSVFNDEVNFGCARNGEVSLQQDKN
jgi:hypothetical protein